ncbi:Peptidyl-prolyl cis-trans isomerase-like 2 [Pteropus alecto]|uniref:Peptidyl-prolyl cis-trans isomerase-like 2 n=1 Tax=Pteropus alecto TaxID=9402 RepID=L5KVV0_PTEAL|nr:Peptidyl-prolyl cis-trans isomerase-like 2 [Pteropus alecto]
MALDWAGRVGEVVWSEAPKKMRLRGSSALTGREPNGELGPRTRHARWRVPLAPETVFPGMPSARFQGRTRKYLRSSAETPGTELAVVFLLSVVLQPPLPSPWGSDSIRRTRCTLPVLNTLTSMVARNQKLDGRSLIKLNFATNSEGKYHCPVLFTVFTNNTHIVAVRPTGNVYAYEAVEQLNIKAKNFRDLLTDEPFSRQDIITLQDPTNLDKFNVSNFFHVKNNMKMTDPDEEKAKQDPSYYLKNTNAETRETLQELYKEFKGDEVLAATMKVPEKKKVDKLNAAHYSTGKVSASFTSTAMVPETTHEAAAIDEDVLRYQFVKKKGYVRLHTNRGDLNLELHCDMIQGGDPTGTGTGTYWCWGSLGSFGCPFGCEWVGGESYWGKPFKDEFRPNLSHTGRGILSMANSGPNTNKSQFFITFRSCAYLDKKHTIFGRVVGGFDTLTAMENVESDPKTDRPKEEIRIDSTTVFVDPYEEADAQIAEERKKTQLEVVAPESTVKKSQPKSGSLGPPTYRQGVGKYINPAATKRVAEEEPSTSAAVPVAKKKPSRGFGDFSSW